MLPFDKDCTTQFAEKLINLYAEYVEGDVDSSKAKYDKLIETVTIKDVMYIVYHTPFEYQSVQLYNCHLKSISDQLPIELLEKIISDMKSIVEMKKILQHATN
jgi:hypothetical protein